MDSIYSDEEYPKNETDYPSVPCSPVLEHKLGRRQIGRNGNRIVKPVVPREGKPVRGGEESCGIGVE